MREKEKETVIIIPTYNNAAVLGKVVRSVLAFNLPVWVVNDGSTDDTLQVLTQFPDVRVISYEKNRGKGHALKVGLQTAAQEDFRYAITMDSDGQHFADDIPSFLQAAKENPDSLIIGARNLTSENMPGKNTFANKFSNFWFRLETGLKMEDTQSGFRLYPLRKLQNMRFFTPKYEFELEVIVRAAWKGVKVTNIPVKVYYPPAGERISHFRPFRDFTRISILNSILVTIALLWYWPVKCIQNCNRQNIKKFFLEQIACTNDSNTRITCAIMFGIFMGIIPIWGYQMITAAALAHLMKLNKAIVLVASNISLPPVIPFILFGSYITGGWMLDRPVTLGINEITFDILKDSLIQYLCGSIIFAALLALIAGIVSIILLSIFRKQQSLVQ